MCNHCGCKGAETFDAEREIHQLITYGGNGEASTLVFENPDDIKDYLYYGLYGFESLYDEDWYIDEEGAEELNKKNFDKKTKNMSIDEVIKFLHFREVSYKKTNADLDKDFLVDGEYGGIEQASFKKLEDGIYRAEEFGAEGKKVEIRRIVGNQDMKIGELDWEQMDEYDDVDYFLKTINDRLETDNMPDGYGIYMMEPKNSMKAEEFGAEEKLRVKNITNVGEKVIVSIGDDIYEGSMEDVMLNDYTNSRGQKITFDAESTPFAEGRNAAKTMWMPDSTKEDYYSGVDTEYMITYDITPDELMQEIENNSSRYLQFFSGWDDGWNESSLVGLGVIQDPMQEYFDDDDVMMDYEFAGEYIGDEYVPSDKEVMAYGGVAVLLLSAVFGYKMTERMLKKSETFKAPETCTNDDDCPDGKVCVDGQCLPICEDDGDCASWQECRSDLHPTEKVCGEDLTYSTSNPFIPTPKPQENAEQPPEKTESLFSPKNLAVGGGVVAVALVGLTAMRMKGSGDE